MVIRLRVQHEKGVELEVRISASLILALLALLL